MFFIIVLSVGSQGAAIATISNIPVAEALTTSTPTNNDVPSHEVIQVLAPTTNPGANFVPASPPNGFIGSETQTRFPHCNAFHALRTPGMHTAVVLQASGTTVRAPTPERPVLADHTRDVPLVVSEVVASQVCAMILSATGTFTHNGASNLSCPQGYAFMCFAHVKKANIRVFDTEKKLTADPNFSYVNMPPDQAYLANKRPSLVVIEGSEHRTDLLNAKNPRNAFRIEVYTKSTRNMKHIAFATMCFMWMKTYAEKDGMHSFKSALESYRLQGLHTIGCVRYAEKVGVKRVLLCSRLNGGSCIEDHANIFC